MFVRLNAFPTYNGTNHVLAIGNREDLSMISDKIALFLLYCLLVYSEAAIKYRENVFKEIAIAKKKP